MSVILAVSGATFSRIMATTQKMNMEQLLACIESTSLRAENLFRNLTSLIGIHYNECYAVTLEQLQLRMV